MTAEVASALFGSLHTDSGTATRGNESSGSDGEGEEPKNKKRCRSDGKKAGCGKKPKARAAREEDGGQKDEDEGVGRDGSGKSDEVQQDAEKTRPVYEPLHPAACQTLLTLEALESLHSRLFMKPRAPKRSAGSGDTGDADAGKHVSPEKSQYELDREARIQRNAEYLASLGIENLATSDKASSKTTEAKVPGPSAAETTMSVGMEKDAAGEGPPGAATPATAATSAPAADIGDAQGASAAQLGEERREEQSSGAKEVTAVQDGEVKDTSTLKLKASMQAKYGKDSEQARKEALGAIHKMLKSPEAQALPLAVSSEGCGAAIRKAGGDIGSSTSRNDGASGCSSSSSSVSSDTKATCIRATRREDRPLEYLIQEAEELKLLLNAHRKLTRPRQWHCKSLKDLSRLLGPHVVLRRQNQGMLTSSGRIRVCTILEPPVTFRHDSVAAVTSVRLSMHFTRDGQ